MKQLPIDLIAKLDLLESYYISLAILESGGNGVKAAKLLGLNYRQWRFRLDKFNSLDKAAATDPDRIP